MSTETEKESLYLLYIRWNDNEPKIERDPSSP